MLKGHVFAKQTFGNPIFALFVDTFLNGKCGIANYKNNMQVTYNSSILTVSSGAVCIRGRFLEEDNSTDIPVGIENGFCKLVIEVNLDNINTENDFTQASYKVLKNSSMYPILTQTDIVKNNSGIYQFELAKFKVNSQGVTDFEDTRTYIDFEGLIAAFNDELNKVKKNSDLIFKNSFAVLEGNTTVEPNTESGVNYTPTSFSIAYPNGFNKNNCVCISFGTTRQNSDKVGFCFGTGYTASAEYMLGELPRRVLLKDTGIECTVRNPSNNQYVLYYKIVLMKI